MKIIFNLLFLSLKNTVSLFLQRLKLLQYEKMCTDCIACDYIAVGKYSFNCSSEESTTQRASAVGRSVHLARWRYLLRLWHTFARWYCGLHLQELEGVEAVRFGSPQKRLLWKEVVLGSRGLPHKWQILYVLYRR